MIGSQTAFDEIAEFIASMDPRKLVAFKASEAVQNQIDHLLEKNREDALTADERVELEHFLMLDHLISLAKIRAEKKLRLLQPA